MNQHKIFRQLADLPVGDAFHMRELLDDLAGAKEHFKNVGVEFTYDGFVNYYKRLYESSIKRDPAYYAPYLKILEGTNLDTIERLAEEKGLIPKE